MSNIHIPGKYRSVEDLKAYVKQANFDNEKKGVLNLLLNSKMSFIPYSYDMDWDYVYSEFKNELVEILIKNKWKVDFGFTHMDTDIFLVLIDFGKTESIEFTFGKDAAMQSFNRENFKILEIYLTEHEILEALNKGLIKNTGK